MKYLLSCCLICVVFLTKAQELRMELPLIHTGFTKRVIFSNNSKYILSANQNAAFIWDSKTAKKIRSFTDHTDEISDIAFSPDDKYFLTSSGDGTINIYEVATGKLFQHYKSKNGSIRFAKFSSDGTKVSVINHYSTLEIYDLKTSSVIFSFSDQHTFMSAQFSSDDKYLMLHKSGSLENNINHIETVMVFDLASAKLLFKYSAETSEFSASFRPDNKSICVYDSIDRVFDISSAKEIEILKNSGLDIKFLKLSPDGKLAYIKALSDKKEELDYVYDLLSSKKIFDFSNYNLGDITAYCPDSRYLAFANRDSTVKIFELSNGKLLHNFTDHILSDEMVPINLMDPKPYFSKNSSLLKTRSSRNYDEMILTQELEPYDPYVSKSDIIKVRIYDLSTGKLLLTISEGYEKAYDELLSPDSRYMLRDYRYRVPIIYDLSSGKVLSALEGKSKEVEHIDEYNQTGQLFSLGSFPDETVSIWDMFSGKMLQVMSYDDYETKRAQASQKDKSHFKKINELREKDHNIVSCTYSPNKKFALIYRRNYPKLILRLYDVKSAKVLFDIEEPNQDYRLLAFSPDSKYFITWYINNVRVYDVSTGREVPKVTPIYREIVDLFFEDDLIVRSYCNRSEEHNEFFSTNRRYRVDIGNKSARIYKAGDNKPFIEVNHEDNLSYLRFVSDNKYLISCGSDHKTIVWDLKNGRRLYTRIQIGQNDWLVYDDDYRYDGSPAARDLVYYVCGMEMVQPKEKDPLYVPNLVEKIMKGDDLKDVMKFKNMKLCKE